MTTVAWGTPKTISDRVARASPMTPVQRARQMRAPALSLPPTPPRIDRQRRLNELELFTSTGTLPIGKVIQGDPGRTLALGETGTLTMNVDDTSGNVRQALTDQLRTVDGARVVVDGIVYVVQGRRGASSLEIRLEDEVSWRMRIFRSFIAFDRDRFNRAQAFRELVREAGSAPMTPIRAWIPELLDKQRIAKVAVDIDGGPTTKKGTGRSLDFKVKGKDATPAQRKVLDATLSEVARLRGSRRVMIGTVMMKTQESVMGKKKGRTGNDDIGDSQQGREWISEANAKDPAKTTRAFLLGSEAGVGGTGAVKGWKQRFGSLRTAPGNLDGAITSVQISSGGYAQWEAEATKTVDAWLGRGGGTAGEVVEQAYEFTRGDRDGGRETSWSASGRWAEEVGWQRTAMLNTACWTSEDELRAAAIALHIDGGEPWLLGELEPDTAATRPAEEITFDALTERWGMLPGAAITLDRKLFDIYGRWLVSRVEDTLCGDKSTITIRRPMEKSPEPAPSTESAGGETETGGATTIADKVFAAAKQISDQGRSYVYGGGHGPKLASLVSTRSGLDCSSSSALALYLAGAYSRDVAIVSGEFAASFGAAGRGKYFTVWANGGHVWIEFHGKGRDGWRFDTSPQGSGERGPRLRSGSRSNSGFTPRHLPGS